MASRLTSMTEAASSPAPAAGALQLPFASAERPAAIMVEDVDKTFRVPRQLYSTFKERALHPFRSREFDELRALDGVSLTIPRGEFFGIVGRNGSGKSTLLKCLAGIYEADSGTITVDGKLSPFIELGVGFNMDLTARENVLINAILLGLTPREARRRFDDIIAFAELEEFLDLKLKNYSSGMHVRLAFAVATQTDAEVLLIDEVLAVGDAAFQQKCFRQFRELKAAGRTIVLVTHDMQAVERFCDRAMLIERGQVVDVGDPHLIARAYNEINFGRLVHEAGGRYGAHAEAEITGAWFENAAGERIDSLVQGESLRIVVEARFHATLHDPVFGLALRNQEGHTIFATRTDYRGVTIGRCEAGTVATVTVTLDNWLAPSVYQLTPSMAREVDSLEALDLREDLASLTVHGSGNSGGVFDAPHGIEIARR
jgi:ABC-type polysaccharide/polyol phosphate transport system ATPase subunit